MGFFAFLLTFFLICTPPVDASVPNLNLLETERHHTLFMDAADGWDYTGMSGLHESVTTLIIHTRDIRDPADPSNTVYGMDQLILGTNALPYALRRKWVFLQTHVFRHIPNDLKAPYLAQATSIILNNRSTSPEPIFELMRGGLPADALKRHQASVMILGLMMLPETYWTREGFDALNPLLEDTQRPTITMLTALQECPREARWNLVTFLPNHLDPTWRRRYCSIHGLLSPTCHHPAQRFLLSFLNVLCYGSEDLFQTLFDALSILNPVNRMDFIGAINSHALGSNEQKIKIAPLLARTPPDQWSTTCQDLFFLSQYFGWYGTRNVEGESLFYELMEIKGADLPLFFRRLKVWGLSMEPQGIVIGTHRSFFMGNVPNRTPLARCLVLLTPDYWVFEVFECVETLLQGNALEDIRARLLALPQRDRYLRLSVAALKQTPEARLAAL